MHHNVGSPVSHYNPHRYATLSSHHPNGVRCKAPASHALDQDRLYPWPDTSSASSINNALHNADPDAQFKTGYPPFHLPTPRYLHPSPQANPATTWRPKATVEYCHTSATSRSPSPRLYGKTGEYWPPAPPLSHTLSGDGSFSARRPPSHPAYSRPSANEPMATANVHSLKHPREDEPDQGRPVQPSKRQKTAKMHRCTIRGCGKEFPRPSALKTHMNSHTGDQPFQCKECHKKFSVLSNMKRHLRVHQGPRSTSRTVPTEFNESPDDVNYGRYHSPLESPLTSPTCDLSPGTTTGLLPALDERARRSKLASPTQPDTTIDPPVNLGLISHPALLRFAHLPPVDRTPSSLSLSSSTSSSSPESLPSVTVDQQQKWTPQWAKWGIPSTVVSGNDSDLATVVNAPETFGDVRRQAVDPRYNPTPYEPEWSAHFNQRPQEFVPRGYGTKESFLSSGTPRVHCHGMLPNPLRHRQDAH